jgi:hypothetical protein
VKLTQSWTSLSLDNASSGETMHHICTGRPQSLAMKAGGASMEHVCGGWGAQRRSQILAEMKNTGRNFLAMGSQSQHA